MTEDCQEKKQWHRAGCRASQAQTVSFLFSFSKQLCENVSCGNMQPVQNKNELPHVAMSMNLRLNLILQSD